MEETTNQKAENENKSRHYGKIAVVALLLLALFSSVGVFLVWILGGISVYFTFLSFHYRPRKAKAYTGHHSYSQSRWSQQPGFSNPDTPTKVRRAVQILIGVVVFLFLFFFIVGLVATNTSDGDRSESASNESRQILDKDPTNIKALTDVGNEFYESGSYDSAIYYYDKVLELEPRNTAALFNKGLIFYNQQNYQSSVETLKRCLDADGSNQNAAFVMGHNYYDQQQYDEAFTWYSRAYESGLRDAFLSHALAFLYDEKRGNTSQALFHYKEALQLDSSRVEIYSRLAELEPSRAEFYNKKKQEWSK